jgi:2-dehydro-3-deoxy-D-arabinonate dehydratase
VWKLYRTKVGILAEEGPGSRGAGESPRLRILPGAAWDALFTCDDPAAQIGALFAAGIPWPSRAENAGLLAPIAGQEVWAAGVTYFRSRDARMEEAEAAGGGTFYDRVYRAERPELFFKATAHRVAGHGEGVRIRSDASWNVPEPELTLAVNPRGHIFGYTIGNDVSSRDIEGENPLYLPQAKVYDHSCALGPGLVVTDAALPPETRIELEVERGGTMVCGGVTALRELKRRPEELVGFLFRDQSFPAGCYLLTGTGIIPPPDFTLAKGDEIRITIETLGTLTNHVL